MFKTLMSEMGLEVAAAKLGPNVFQFPFFLRYQVRKKMCTLGHTRVHVNL